MCRSVDVYIYIYILLICRYVYFSFKNIYIDHMKRVYRSCLTYISNFSVVL